MQKIIRIEKELEGIILKDDTIDEFLELIRKIYQIPILVDLSKEKKIFIEKGYIQIKIQNDIFTAKKGDVLLKHEQYGDNITYEFVPKGRFKNEYKIK